MNVSSTIARTIFCKSFSSTAASDVIKQSMVAILGCIIPEPLHIPPICTIVPSISNSTATCFDLVSVVIIASAARAASAAVSPSCPGSLSIPFPIISIGSCFPITPVLATRTASSSIPSFSAVFAAISRHFSYPSSPVHALAIPLFTTIACALFDSNTTFLSHFTGAAHTLLVVNVPALTHGISENTSAISFLTLFLIPALSPVALKPFDAHTPPSIYLISYPPRL